MYANDRQIPKLVKQQSLNCDDPKQAANRQFESLVTEFMFKQWGIEWDIVVVFSSFVRGEIDHGVRLCARLG